MTTVVHTDTDYLGLDLFQGDEGEISCRKVRMVTTRKPHQCFNGQEPHLIPAGTRARFESALIDSDHWGRYYTCVSCLDRWLSDLFGEDDDE